MTAVNSPLVDALRDHYLLERELGRGGMATVYLARDLRHDRPVALKVLHRELTHTLGPERFLREIRTTARLDHPHILPVHDSGQAEGLLWYTMPYVEGETLRDRLRRERQLPVDEAVRLAREVADALEFAHRHGIVHRDIKPENILLGETHARVADFGVAKALESEEGGRLTETGLAIGTPAYMSPEQATSGPVDVRTDIYALGCVLYEMLAGEPPYTGTSAQAVLAKRLSEPVPHLGTLRQVPAHVEAAVTKALAKAPADRFDSARAFSDALASDSRTTDIEKAGLWASRRGSRAAVLAAVGLIVATGLTILLISRSRRPSLPAPARPALAVVPFHASGPGLGLWREGLVSLFSVNLDQAGELRTMSERTVLSRWQRAFGDADPEMAQAIQLAGELGAQHALTGSLVGTSSGVRLIAEVYRTSDGTLEGRVQAEGQADSIPALVDRASLELLESGALGSAQGLSPKGVGQLFTQSLPALKAYLAGEQKFRGFQPREAIPDFQRAIALDSTFAMALSRLSLVTGWSESPHWLGRSSDLSTRALRFASRMGHREQLMLLGMWQMEEGWVKALGTFRQLAKERPEDAEVWFLLGDAQFHLAGSGLEPGEDFRESLQKSVMLDPRFGPAYLHLTEDAFDRGDSAAVRRYINALWALDSTAPRAVGLRIARDVSWGNAELRQAALSRLDIATHEAAMAAKHAINMTVDLGEATLAITDRIMRNPRHDARTRGIAANGSIWVYVARGQLDRARRAWREAGRLLAWPENRVKQTAADWELTWYLVGTGDSAAAAAGLAELMGSPDSVFADEKYDAEVGWLAVHWNERSVLVRAVRSLERSEAEARGAHDSAGARHTAALLQLLRSLRSGNEDLILSTFPTAIKDLPAPSGLAGTPSYFGRLEMARRLYARGDYDGAERYLKSFTASQYHPSPTIIALWLGRVYEGKGDRVRAAEEYGKVARWWKDADPFLQPLRKEALEALRRVTAEPTGR